MTKTLFCLLFAAAVVAANPYVRTLLYEVSAAPAHQFVELHSAPDHPAFDLTNWRLVTSSSACTLTCQLGNREFLLVDSVALSSGEVGFGTFRLNPQGDSIVLISDSGPVADIVHYPRSPTCHKSAPLPPANGSIAFWNRDDWTGQSMNWYADSTPTPDGENDNCSRIGGTVNVVGGDTLHQFYVFASGTNGRCNGDVYQGYDYSVGGLGAGKYEIRAEVFDFNNMEWYEGIYPESVTVGYSQAVSGIDIVVSVPGVAETKTSSVLPLLRVSGRTLLLGGDGSAPVKVTLYNQVGSRVSASDLGPIKGEKRIELLATLSPGVYFATAQKGTYRSTVKVVLW